MNLSARAEAGEILERGIDVASGAHWLVAGSPDRWLSAQSPTK